MGAHTRVRGLTDRGTTLNGKLRDRLAPTSWAARAIPHEHTLKTGAKGPRENNLYKFPLARCKYVVPVTVEFVVFEI
jgi:hypothetical protein